MILLDELSRGDAPPDPDLISILAAEGIDSLEAARARGRQHFVDLLADRAGFQRDFVELLDDMGLTWEQAATADAFQCPPDELEIGTASMMVALQLGADTFGDVFRHPPETVKAALAERDGMLGELDGLLTSHGLRW